jgi:hypothetical protein
MEARMDPCVLWARASVVGTLAFLLGVAGHVMADGLLPGPLFLAGLLAFSVLLGVPMLNRPAGPVRLVALLVGGQTFIHLVLSVAAGHAGDAATSSGSTAGATGLRTLPTVDGHRVGSLQDAYQGMSGHASATAPALPVGHLINDLSAHAPMMVVHLAAAALVGLWLARGEACLWTILALTGRRIVAAVLLVVPVDRPRSLPAAAADRVLAVARSLWLVRPDSRRGPPLPAV